MFCNTKWVRCWCASLSYCIRVLYTANVFFILIRFVWKIWQLVSFLFLFPEDVQKLYVYYYYCINLVPVIEMLKETFCISLYYTRWGIDFSFFIL